MKNPMNERPKRILIFSLVYYPRFIGGAEVAVKEITDRISQRDFEFDMITLRLDSRLPKFERTGNINVHRVGWALKQREPSDSLPWPLHLNKYAMLWTAFTKALSLNRIRKYDAIWSIMATYNSFAALFFKLTHPKIPFLLTLQEGDPISYIKRRALLLYPLFKMIFTKADKIQAISNYLADWAREMNARCPISVVPNGVAVQHFQLTTNDQQQRETTRANLGFPKDDVVLITTSRLVVKNAVGDIIRALELLSERVKLLIIGTGYQERELKKLAADLRLHNRVKFLGFISHAEMPAYLWMSDIFIRPSLSEGMGNSFIEAMAAGLPVIATPVGGIPDLLKDKETGVFCRPNDPKSVAETVKLLVADHVLRDKVVQNASKMVAEKYDWKIVAGKMAEILKFDRNSF